jgi:hypothetical protein
MFKKTSIVFLLLYMGTLAVFAKSEPESHSRMIDIACVPHKTFSNDNNIAKIINAVEMRSTDVDFGGISALLIRDTLQKAYLLTDRAYLITADTIFNPKTHAIDCFKNLMINPLRGRSSNPLSGHYADSEGISSGSDNKKILISFERHHRVVSYNPQNKRLLPQKDYKPFDKDNLPFNESYESVLRLADKSIIAFPERYEIQENILRGFLLKPDGKTLQNLQLKRMGGFWLTDLRQLDNGDFITLERSFDIFSGMAVQMRHIKQIDFLSGEPADGKVIFKMQSGDGVDNFEGLDIIKQADDSYMFYISSDNNFSNLQKTLLLSVSYKP